MAFCAPLIGFCGSEIWETWNSSEAAIRISTFFCSAPGQLKVISTLVPKQTRAKGKKEGREGGRQGRREENKDNRNLFNI